MLADGVGIRELGSVVPTVADAVEKKDEMSDAFSVRVVELLRG